MSGLRCREYRAPLIELSRGAAVDSGDRRALAAHLRECALCAREFEEQSALTAALREMSDAPMPAAAGALEAKLLAEFDRVQLSARRPVWRWMAIAASLLVASILTGRLLIRPPRPEIKAPLAHVDAPMVRPLETAARPPAAPHPARVHKRATRPAAKDNADTPPFFAIPYTLPLAPHERAQILRVDLPVTAVIAAGLPLEVADPSARAEADVLVGQDGRARAIRVLSISTSISDRRPNE